MSDKSEAIAQAYGAPAGAATAAAKRPTRCEHGMIAAWCQDCIEAAAREMGCGVTA